MNLKEAIEIVLDVASNARTSDYYGSIKRNEAVSVIRDFFEGIQDE